MSFFNEEKEVHDLIMTGIWGVRVVFEFRNEVIFIIKCTSFYFWHIAADEVLLFPFSP